MSGSGGSFLSHLLWKAKTNNFDTIMFSEHGNAHAGKNTELAYELPILNTFGPSAPDDVKIKSLLSFSFNEGAKPPCFQQIHVSDVAQLASLFQQVICITYEEDDKLEIAAAFLGKYVVDEKKIQKKFFTKHMGDGMYRNVNTFHSCFTYNENLTNVLYVSWKELYKEDHNILFEKLSKYTDIPKTNFDVQALTVWRDRTRFCIEEFRPFFSN